MEDRPEIDRWILSNLQSLIQTAHERFPEYDVASFCEAAATFIDDLSNWYIRRNRRRFWRSKDASDTDKTAAYETLYEVLVRLCQLLAPCIPFLTERMYQNLVLGRECSNKPQLSSTSSACAGDNRSTGGASGTQEPYPLPESVHLCDYPTANATLLDEALNKRMAAAQLVVKLGHKLREENTLRVRQPLAELQYAANDPETADAVYRLADVIQEELNIETITQQPNLDELVGYSYKPNLKTLGPKYGKLLGVLRTQLPEMGDDVLNPLRQGQNLSIEIDGNSIELTPDDVLISTEQAEDWVCRDEAGVQIAINTILTPDLVNKGIARDLIRNFNAARNVENLEERERIHVLIDEGENESFILQLREVLSKYTKWVNDECRIDKLVVGPPKLEQATYKGGAQQQQASPIVGTSHRATVNGREIHFQVFPVKVFGDILNQ